MNTLLIVGGVAVVGGGAYLLLRKRGPAPLLPTPGGAVNVATGTPVFTQAPLPPPLVSPDVLAAKSASVFAPASTSTSTSAAAWPPVDLVPNGVPPSPLQVAIDAVRSKISPPPADMSAADAASAVSSLSAQIVTVSGMSKALATSTANAALFGSVRGLPPKRTTLSPAVAKKRASGVVATYAPGTVSTGEEFEAPASPVVPSPVAALLRSATPPLSSVAQSVMDFERF